MTPSRILVRSLPLFAASAWLAACAAVPDVGPKPQLRDSSTVSAGATLDPLATAAEWPEQDWWRAYGEPQLDTLIEEALRNSPDIAAARARFAKAAAIADQAGARLLPTLDANGQVTVDKQSYNNGFPKEFLPQGWQDRGMLALDTGFDLDLWGRNRSALAAATSEAQAAAIEARQARLLLTTAIADSYAELARLHAERDIAARSLALREETRQLVDDRVTIGLDTRGDLRQSEANSFSASANLAAIDEAIALRRNQLAALIGAGPDRGLSIARPGIALRAPHALPSGVTTGLIARRADIAAALARTEAAAERIDVARADFFPAIRIDALIGLQALGLDNLFSNDSTYGTAGPAISLPIFHGGELRGRYRGARADYDAAVADYNSAVVTAYREVADAVTSRHMLDERLGQASAALDASEEAYNIARLRYQGGLSTYLDLLLVEERLLDARRAVATLDMRGFALDVALVRALGGGFDSQGPIEGLSQDPTQDNDNG